MKARGGEAGTCGKGGCVYEEENGTLERGLGLKIEWAALCVAWKRLCRQDPAELCDALAALSWTAGTWAPYPGHIRALATLAAARLSLVPGLLPQRYIKSIFAKGQSKLYMRSGFSAVRALEDMGWIEKLVQPKHRRMAQSTLHKTEEQRPYGGLEAQSVLAQCCHTRVRWTGFPNSVLSFTCLWRMGEAAGQWNRGLRNMVKVQKKW